MGNVFREHVPNYLSTDKVSQMNAIIKTTFEQRNANCMALLFSHPLEASQYNTNLANGKSQNLSLSGGELERYADL